MKYPQQNVKHYGVVFMGKFVFDRDMGSVRLERIYDMVNTQAALKTL